MKKLSVLFSLIFAAILILAACGANEPEEDEVNNSNVNEENNNENNNQDGDVNIDETIKVYTTLYPLEDFANRIGGEYVEVTNIIPAGADAHSFEPTANQMIEIAEGDLFIYNGAGFEAFAERIEETIASHDVNILTAAEGIDLIDYHHDHDHGHDHDHNHDHNDDHNHAHNDDHNHDHNDDHNHDHNDDHNHDHNDDNNHNHNDEDNNHNHGHNNNDDHTNNDHNHNHEDDENNHGHDHAHGDEDPHIWLDPLRAIEMAENIKDALVELNPAAEETFTENFESLRSELEELDQEFIEMSEEVSNNTIVVSHAGYGYWEERYGIHQIGIAGISPTNEPSIQQMQDVIGLMEENDINHVMFEQNIPQNIAQTVQSETGSESLWLHNLETLTEEEIEAGEDYFSHMRSNIETLRTALQ
ncbi:metal ABC transporter solute-binding protein, Zn/Mn family [Evansella clarkii]|uniref:metal ABC transporter solute-binding protein, Zn/Mn family n=1 Tax=Evansella clarkii TaxID=79879 RepID=UPI0009989505|nr:zinc ABC transporter substrate-binding protein [Evansella clarkii]